MKQINHSYDDQCIFCKIVKKEIPANIIYENDYSLAYLDINPNSNGHTLVIPKSHFKDLTSTDEIFFIEVQKTKKMIAQMLLDSKLQPTGINYVSNQGKEAFQEVFHYHEHIIPKYIKNDGYTFKINVNNDDKKDLEEILKIIKN